MNINEKVKAADEMMYGYKSLEEETASLIPNHYGEVGKPFSVFSFGRNSTTHQDKTILRKRRFR